jgi:phage shock protein C
MTGYYSERRKLYRSRNGEILGVCRGIAEWRDFPVSAVRLIFILLVLFAGMSIWVYFILALILPAEPDCRDRRYHSSSDTRSHKEDKGFDKEKDWDDRFSSGQH